MADEDKDQPRSLYERDFYAWARREAVLLQRRDFDQLDLDNVIEELDSLGRQEREHWEDHITWVIELLLLLEHGRHIDDQTLSRWTDELWQSQCVIARQIRDNPSLRELGEAAVARCWHHARRRACTELDSASDSIKSKQRGRRGLWEEILPKRCPFSYAQIAREEATSVSDPYDLLQLPVETP